jgi:hypothetical protein
MKTTKRFLVATIFVALAFTFGFSQEADTAYVPVLVNASATVSMQPFIKADGVSGDERNVMPMVLDTLKLILNQDSASLLSNPVQQSLMQAKAPATASFSRGKVFLNLHAQSFRNADISLFSLNGKQILRGKTYMSANVTEGVYFLTVKGANGNFFATRLIHQGGSLSIDVAFSGEGLSSAPLKKETDSDAWIVNVQAAGYSDTSYAFFPVKGVNDLHVITLNPLAVGSSSSLGGGNSSSSSSLESDISSSSSEEASSSSLEEDIFGSTPKVVENPQKGLGTANFNFPAIRYIMQA